MKLGSLKLWSRTDLGRRIIASWHSPGQGRWHWALYHSRHAGYGLRFASVRDATFRRRRIFVDSPLTGVFSLYIQDVSR
jgi:hypothetical protein